MEHGSTSPGSHARQDAVEHGSTSPRSQTRADPDEPCISLTVERGDETTRLVVSDDGPGIPREERPSAFRPGGETDGGGLRIAATLVERYGGDLRVRDDDGATVVVELPSATADRDASTADPRPLRE
ncbi:ATP-binding protein [Halosimplex aquaticum]